jgi:hypothetical protein
MQLRDTKLKIYSASNTWALRPLRWFSCHEDKRDYSSVSGSVQTGSGVHPDSYPMGTGGSISSVVKRPKREADNSFQSSRGVKDYKLYHPPLSLHALHKDKFGYHVWPLSRTNSMQEKPSSWATSRSGMQWIFRLSWKLRIHFQPHKI